MDSSTDLRESWKSKWGIVSFMLLILFAGAHLAVLFAGLRFFLPNVWERQFEAGIPVMIAVFLIFSIMHCFVECFFHRYVMHMMIVSRLFTLMDRHEKHHFVWTPISLHVSENKIVKKIESYYLITEEKQLEFLHFRNSIFLIFFAFYALPFALLQWLFPLLPILLGGWIAIVVYATLYEIMHALEHKNETFWISRFHQYHHLRPGYNMAIVGFFGFPLADFVFGTFKSLSYALRDGMTVNKADLAPPKPCRLIQWLDRWALKRQKKLFQEMASDIK